MVSELYQAKCKLQESSRYEYVFDSKLRNAMAIGAEAIGIVERLGDIEALLKKEKPKE